MDLWIFNVKSLVFEKFSVIVLIESFVIVIESQVYHTGGNILEMRGNSALLPPTATPELRTMDRIIITSFYLI